MRPAAIALNYSVKDIRHDVRQIIYIYIIYHEKSQFNRPVSGSLTLAPIKPVPLAVSQACGDCVGCSCYVTIAYLLCKNWITLSFHYEPCPVSDCYIHFLQPLQLCLPPPACFFLHPSPCCSIRLTFFCVPYFCFHFLSVLLSSFCSASFLSSLPSVDSEIPVLHKFQLSLSWVYCRSRNTSM